jgi:hypothetical protein
MGGILSVNEGGIVKLMIRTSGGEAGDTVELISGNGKTLPLADSRIESSEHNTLHEFASDGGYDWLRVNVRDSGGKLLLLSNPVYINAPGDGAQ